MCEFDALVKPAALHLPFTAAHNRDASVHHIRYALKSDLLFTVTILTFHDPAGFETVRSA